MDRFESMRARVATRNRTTSAQLASPWRRVPRILAIPVVIRRTEGVARPA